MASGGLVLLADDDPVVRSTDSLRLARLGYECQTAPDADSAMALLADRDYDVLISDIDMPGNDELALVTRAQALRPGLPVLIVTGSPSFDTARAAVGLGVRAYLLKPVSMDVYAAEMEAAVHVRRLWRAVQDAGTRLAPLAGDEDALVDAGLEALLWSVASAATQLGAIQAQAGRLAPGQVRSEMAAAVPQTDLVDALRETVEVLHDTKNSFRSKALARLRHRLEQLLGVVGQD
ncbi:MAG: response regulator [Armatimonadetes bacterium]|nr:response regulator [Armatimonadota bacterium]